MEKVKIKNEIKKAEVKAKVNKAGRDVKKAVNNTKKDVRKAANNAKKAIRKADAKVVKKETLQFNKYSVYFQSFAIVLAIAAISLAVCNCVSVNVMLELFGVSVLLIAFSLFPKRS